MPENRKKFEPASNDLRNKFVMNSNLQATSVGLGLYLNNSCYRDKVFRKERTLFRYVILEQK